VDNLYKILLSTVLRQNRNDTTSPTNAFNLNSTAVQSYLTQKLKGILPNASGNITENELMTAWLLANSGGGSGTVTSVDLSSNGTALTISGNPITTAGTIAVDFNGAVTDYVDGTGALRVFPTIPTGTVTNVSALTLGTTGTDLSSTVANSTTTPVITLNVPTASALNRGALSAADWTAFNNKQNAISPAALTKTDDTNVTLTLGGTPATALLQATSLTLGWSGQLAISRGGTGGNLYAGWDLITTSTASSSSTIDFTGLSSTYKIYKVVFFGVYPATNGVQFGMRVGTGGTPTYDTGNNYQWLIDIAQGTTTTGASVLATGDASGNGIYTMNGTISNSANYRIMGEFTIYDPAQTSNFHQIDYKAANLNSSNPIILVVNGSAWYKSTTAITALRFFMSSGNITAGTFKLYGIR
jgi:hypothetical protein